MAKIVVPVENAALLLLDHFDVAHGTLHGSEILGLSALLGEPDKGQVNQRAQEQVEELQGAAVPAARVQRAAEHGRRHPRNRRDVDCDQAVTDAEIADHDLHHRRQHEGNQIDRVEDDRQAIDHQLVDVEERGEQGEFRDTASFASPDMKQDDEQQAERRARSADMYIEVVGVPRNPEQLAGVGRAFEDEAIKAVQHMRAMDADKPQRLVEYAEDEQSGQLTAPGFVERKHAGADPLAQIKSQ